MCANLLVRMQVNRQLAVPEFCIYWLRTSAMRKHVKTTISGTNPRIQKINQEKILSFPFLSDIPVDAQRRLVNRLDGLQDKVNRLNILQAQSATELDALLPAILDKAFKGAL